MHHQHWYASSKAARACGSRTLMPLLLLLLYYCRMVFTLSTLYSEPQCSFPAFLQTKPGKPWMMNQRDTLTTFSIQDGRIYARSGTCLTSQGVDRRRVPASGEAECTESNYTRVCLEPRLGGKYLLGHHESTFGDRFMCIEFLRRSDSVVQVRMSLPKVESFRSYLCEESYLQLDPWLWVSEERYRSETVACPFMGGLNLRLTYSSPAPTGHVSLNLDSTVASVRVESSCVASEGVAFQFKDKSCLPTGIRLHSRHHMMCMATWTEDGEDFAMLRSANNDRSFWCLRVTNNTYGEIQKVALFLGWMCHTTMSLDYTRRHETDTSRLAPYMMFDVRDRRNITEPCSDELYTCQVHPNFCHGFQCMRTCGKCTSTEDVNGVHSNQISKKATYGKHDSSFVVPKEGAGNSENDENSGSDAESENGEDKEAEGWTSKSTPNRRYQRSCTFPLDIRGTWLQRTSNGDRELVITESAIIHPQIGQLDCITFRPPSSEEIPLRRVLWSHHQNGCYPRFTCMHFNTPGMSVLRYRLANIQHWPLELSDDLICDEKHFLEAPDIFQPDDKYVTRGWEVVRRAGHVQKIACIFPHYMPRVVSFKDDIGRSGCMMHGTYYSPRTITLIFFPTTNLRDHDLVSPEKDDLYKEVSSSESNFHSYHEVTGVGLNRSIMEGAFRRKISDKDIRYSDKESQNTTVNELWKSGASFPATSRQRNSGDKVGKKNKDNKSDDEIRKLHGERTFSREYVNDRIRIVNEDVDYGEDSSNGKPKTGDRKTFIDIYASELHEKAGTSPKGTRPQDTRSHDTSQRKYGRNNVNKRKLRNAPNDIRGDVSVKRSQNIASTVASQTFPSSFDVNSGRKSDVVRTTPHMRSDDSQEGAGMKAVKGHVADVKGGNAQNATHHEKRATRSDANVDKMTYECLAAMTYVDSYKSVLTVTVERPHEVLCWIVVDQYTVVLVKTSACNSQTAERILSNANRHLPHLYRILYLHRGEGDCDAAFPADQIWPEPVKFQDKQNAGTGTLVVQNVPLLIVSISLWVLT